VSARRRPTVGITSYWATVRLGYWQAEAVVAFGGYVEGVRFAGGRPLVIPADPHFTDDPDDLLDIVDAMVFVGGDDVAPELYGAERHPRTGVRHERRDAVELALMRRALERDLPVLAICRGFQLLNVARGGTLVQHLEDVLDQRPHREDDGTYGRHEVVTIEGTRLRSILGERAEVFSHHHQGADRIGEGLVESAHAHDGIVEGIEDPSLRFCVGVLWHPDADPEGRGAPLFRALVSSVR
jgi:putative glutamine amidotransferase